MTPDGLARSARVHFARRLLDDTDLTVTEIASAAGFGSLRQLNRACREVFGESPRMLRARRRKADRLVADGGLLLRLPFGGRLDWPAMLAYFAARAIPGVEHVAGRLSADGCPPHCAGPRRRARGRHGRTGRRLDYPSGGMVVTARAA